MTNDEVAKIEKEQNYAIVTFSALNKFLLNEFEKSNVRSSLLQKYSKEQIINFLRDPKKYQQELRKLSRYLYSVNSHYKQLIRYFSELPTFDYIVEPYDFNIDRLDVEKFKKEYYKILKLLETMNIPHEMQKVLKIAFRDDVFFGYERSTDNSYFIQRLNPDYCRISSIEDGVYNFEFDFSMFDNKNYNINNYPNEFIVKYKLYQKNKNKYRWQELDSKNTICIKINEEIEEYAIPPFSTVFEAVFDIDESKRMRNIKNKMDNYMILTQLIPIKEDKDATPNQFLIDLDTAIMFHNRAISALPDEVGLITSPMKIDAIKLERKNNDADIVAQVERDYYNAAGISQVLFNSEKSNAVALSKSIATDEQFVFSVLRQIERWINRKLKYINTKYKYRVKLLNTTTFNRKDVFESYLKAAQYGMPVKQELAASLGLSPSALINKTFLENDILDLASKLVPLSSSHTQSGKKSNNDSKSPGRPLKNDDELTESGVRVRDEATNIRE